MWSVVLQFHFFHDYLVGVTACQEMDHRTIESLNDRAILRLNSMLTEERKPENENNEGHMINRAMTQSPNRSITYATAPVASAAPRATTFPAPCTSEVANACSARLITSVTMSIGS